MRPPIGLGQSRAPHAPLYFHSCLPTAPPRLHFPPCFLHSSKAPSFSGAFPGLTRPQGCEHLPCAQNRQFSFMAYILPSHSLRLQIQLLRSMRMQTPLGTDTWPHSSVELCTVTGTLLGTQLNDDLLELMFP